MKKILALALVMSVVAMAAVTFENVDNGNGSFTVTVAADEIVTGGFQIASISSTNPAMVASNAVWHGTFSTMQTDFAGNALASGNMTTGGSIAAGETLVTFDVTGVAGDVLTLGSYMSVLNSEYGNAAGNLVNVNGASFTLVPEPMTMALLGLGGLFVRRRNA